MTIKVEEAIFVLDGVLDISGEVKVSSNDSTTGFLNGKLVQGTNITLTENNDGADETLTIAATATTDSLLRDFLLMGA